MAEATLNVRLDGTLKQHGMEVLDGAGMTVTQVVRALFEYMEKNQAVPEELSSARAEDNKFAKRQAMMRSMIGILPADITLEEARQARYTRHGL